MHFYNKQAQLRLCKLRLGTHFKGAQESSIFVVQKAAAPKNEVEFRQRAIGDIRHNLATSHDVLRRHPKTETHWRTDTKWDIERGTYGSPR